MRLTLSEALGRRGWTAEQAAERSGVHRATVYRIVAGDISHPKSDTVEKLETALGLRPGTLVFRQVEAKAS